MVRQTYREGKHVSSFGRKGKLNPIPPNEPNPLCPGSIPLSEPLPGWTVPFGLPPVPPDCDSFTQPPPSGRKCQFVILYNALCTIFVL